MDKSHLLTPFFAIREMMVLWVMALVFGASVILYLVFHYLNVPVQQMVAGTSKISRGVENGSDHILYMSDSFADRTKLEAAVIEETSVAMEQISAAIRRNAENAKEASELMSQAKMEVIDANDTMDELVESMDNIHKASRKTVEIIKTIDDIAFQTNILALNASVEAEKAGEYGLGFGVIAKEIASLARRSAKEARNTSDRIEEGLKIVDDGSDLVMKVGMSFRQLDFKIRKATTLAGEIATATDEQAKGMEQVNQSVAEIDKSIRQNATDAENFVRETDNMLNQAIWLNKWMDELTNQIGVRNGEGMAALWNRVSGEVGPVSKRLQAIGNQPGDLVFSDNKRPVVELPEHALFMNRFYCVCNRMKQEDKYRFSVACFGIDHLNVLNETFGTGVSNRVTRHFRNVLEKRVGRGCVLSRCGDGEYIVLMEDTQSREEAMKRVQEMQREFDRPVNIRKESLRVTAAAGVIYCEPGRYEPLEILNSAKNAMWFSRLGKKDGCYLYNERVYRRVLDFFQLESELQNAIDRNEFELFYQPIIELETGRIIGTEALIRWRHPERGLISPADFLPLAEENGMIVPIGKWVFQQACHQAGRFMKRRNGGEPFILGINVSLKQLLDDGMPGELKQILNESRLSPEQLRLELTEGMMAGEEKDILPLLNELKNMGVRLAIDDFGARRISLNTLDRLPVDTLKIDGSWVEKTTGKDAGSSPDLLHGVMDLASRLQMSVIAEGVETCVQIEKLKKLQCLYGQGYYYSKPMNYENFLHAMEKEIYVNLPERYYEKVEGR